MINLFGTTKVPFLQQFEGVLDDWSAKDAKNYKLIVTTFQAVDRRKMD